MPKLAIIVSNLTKIYPLYNRHIDQLKEFFHPFNKKYHRDFYALNNVSFEIKKGQTVGIIGKNGAGKSTLLSIISGITSQSSGSYELSGKVSPLLKIGAGFNPSISGLENIYFNGIVNGLSRKEIKRKLDEIIEFADIGKYINQPVFTYSSGMYSRLAFAVAINIDPQILIIDETLSVGDSAFRAKCFRKFNDFKKNGTTILFVTHAIDLVIKHCQSAILLDRGRIAAKGCVKDCVELYKKLLSKQGTESEDYYGSGRKLLLMKKSMSLNSKVIEYGTKEAEIIDFCVIDSSGTVSNVIRWNEHFIILMKIRFNSKVNDAIFAFSIKSSDGLELTGTNSQYLGHHDELREEGEEITIKFEQTMILKSGKYLLSLGCVRYDLSSLKVMHRMYDCITIDVLSEYDIGGIASSETKMVILEEEK